jgi:hypothetical protein
MVCDAHLFILQIHASSFGASKWGEMAPLFSVQCGKGRLSMGYVSRISQTLILIDALSSAYWKKEKEREMARGLLSHVWTHLAGCATWDFHSC